MIYYPRAICDLTIAFEDYGRPPKSQILPVGVYVPELSDGDMSSYQDLSTDNLALFAQHSIKVKKYKLERANIRVADQLTITIPYRDAPYDPELIRSAIVTFYAGGVVDNTGADAQELTDQWRVNNMRFTGVVDDWRAVHDDEGHWIIITARDFTAYFIDAYYPANKPIDFHGNLVEVLQRVVDTLKLGTDFVVVADDYPDGVNNVPTSTEYNQPLPIPFEDLNSSAPPSIADILNIEGAQAEQMGYSKMASPYKENISYWDVITGICTLEGFIPYITGEIAPNSNKLQILIHIRRAPDIYAENTNPPLLIWGKNVKSVHFERKLGAIKSPVVLVQSHNIHAKNKHQQMIWATYPPDAFNNLMDYKEKASMASVTGTKPTLVDPRNKLYKAEFKTYIFPNVKDKKTCQRIAEGIYNEIGRQALSGKITTYEMTLDNKNNGTTDILSFRAGDTIELQVQPMDVSSATGIDELSYIRNAPSPQIVNYLIGLGYSSTVAADLADAIKNPFFTKDYKISTIVYDYDIDSGLNIETQFSNYIFQRAGNVKS